MRWPRADTLIGKMTYEDLLSEGDPTYVWQPPADEWQAICLNYTSGTTGNPKGVVYHHRGAYSERARQRAGVSPRPGKRLSVDAADVPLQRLDVHLGGDGGRRHARVFARR